VSQGNHWGDPIADMIGDLFAKAVGLAIAALLLLAFILATEIVQVYRRRALRSTAGSTVLWIAAAVLVGVETASALLIAAQYTTIGTYLAAWSFLLFVLVVELVDWHERQFDPAESETGVHINDTLGSWS